MTTTSTRTDPTINDESRTDTNVSTIRFYLWTRDNSGDDDFDELFVGDGGESILGSRYDGGRRTKVLVHGYGDNGRTGWVRNMKDAYLAKGKQ